MFKRKYLVLAALASVLPATAMADFSGYMGVSVGGSRVERDDINLTVEEYTTGVILGDAPYNTGTLRATRLETRDPEGTDFSFKVYGGVRYGAYLGLEAGYVNLGETEDNPAYILPAINSTALGLPVRPQQDRQLDIQTKIDGWQLSAVGFLPLNDQIELFGKVGLIRWDNDTRVVDRIGGVFPVDHPAIPEVLVSGNIGDLVLVDDTPDGVSFSQAETSESGTDLALGAGIQIKASERVALRAELEWFDIDGTSLAWTGNVGLVFSF